MSLWADLYRPGNGAAEPDAGGFEEFAASNSLPSVSGGGDEVEPAGPQVTKSEQWDDQEEEEPRLSMMDRMNESEAREQVERQSMMDRLNAGEAERERIAKEEQAKLEVDRDTYNQTLSVAPSPAPVEPAPAAPEVVESTPGSDEFGSIMADLESEFSLSEIPAISDEAYKAASDVQDLEERVTTLEGGA